MKKIIFILLFTFSLTTFAQHPDLQRKWFVQEITINETTTEIPSDPIEFPYASLDFWSASFITSANELIDEDCQIGFGAHITHSSTDIFTFNDFTPFSTTTTCSVSLQNFMTSYVSFFNNEIEEQFTYSITTETDESKTLSIISNNGDEIIFTNSFFAITPEELDEVWYLNNLVIDDENYFIPNTDEYPHIALSFDYLTNNNFFTQFCDGVNATVNINNNQSEFYLYSLSTGLIMCNDTDNNQFQNQYFDFFELNLPNAFDYDVTYNGSIKTLTITNSFGDQAIYDEYTTATKEYANTLFSIYPNPTKEYLSIVEKSDIKIKNIEIHNILGQCVIETDNTTIDLSNLNNGLYLLKIHAQNGIIATQKIIKE